MAIACSNSGTVSPGLTQPTGCSPIGPMHRITEADDGRLLSIEEKPAQPTQLVNEPEGKRSEPEQHGVAGDLLRGWGTYAVDDVGLSLSR